eukprot:CAMPEP_0181222050 /NCGR_PEP_ID=MMETSP1096-20121128/29745_1 /TAXON_ID=156174 ORGANISM="Chrysochromulina ericina, Strain CCMP281" /NCGR_SAMPLE_ID=MMETSP1096 /ASSEMBLY_ACC=CAM_ASM_000453 /LENGTH=43 /DNA_ID= /DNA_START= /DNA_END= /DNA_ORIENTATION=
MPPPPVAAGRACSASSVFHEMLSAISPMIVWSCAQCVAGAAWV